MPKIDIYCNSCKYAKENSKWSCDKYEEKDKDILQGGLCKEYIRHKNKELSKELAEKLDMAIMCASDISIEHAISMGRSLKHSQCGDCIKKIGTHDCKVFGKRPDQYSSAFENTPCPHRVISLRSRIKGALYGFAIGDAMGATTEFMTYEEIKAKYCVVKDILGGGWLELNAGEVTDDTQMTLCVCQSLKETINVPRDNGIHDVNFYQKCCDYFVEWYNSKPKDIGNCCRQIISTCKGYEFREWVHRAYNPNSLGNGSLMRTMPLILANETLEVALTQGRLTHNNKICDECIEEYYYILKQCIDGKLDKISQGYQLKFPTGHVENTLNNAMFWLFETNSVEEAIVGAVNHGGDSDTIAAITGSLVGAYYGFNEIPTRWKEELSDEIKELLDKYAEFFTMIYETKEGNRL